MVKALAISFFLLTSFPTLCFAFESDDLTMGDKFDNSSIFALWNNPIRQDDPFAPWNDDFRKDDMNAPWNRPFDREPETNQYMREQEIQNPDYYWKY